MASFEPSSDISRRTFLRRSGELALAGSVPFAFAACGAEEEKGRPAASVSTRVGGGVTMMNFPDWMGETEVADFERKSPGARIKQVPGLTSGDAQAVAQIAQNRDAYDMTIATATLAGQLDAAKLLGEFDPATVPTLAAVPEQFRKAFPWGIPTDFGKIGFGYRSDLITERPTSWADFWRLAAKYSGKATALRFENDVIGAALKYRGLSVNASEPGELAQAKSALVELKPHIKAFLSADFAKPLIDGSAVLAIDYDYDIALAQERNQDIVWVAPDEGLPGYIEGWVPLAGNDNPATVTAFMRNRLEPRVYAGFINTVGAAYVLPAAERYMKRSITGNASLRYAPEQVAAVEFQKYVSPEATALRARLWEEVLAA